MEISEILKALSDDTRLRILNIIKEGEFCVCDIENALELNQSNASKHLNKLKSSKIIKATKKAQWVYYSLNEKTLAQYNFIKTIIEENLSEAIFVKDLENLNEYLKNRKGCEA
ncbi:MAG: winged helix-turn-helix transcriptional regulator [Fusobacteriaceae bacterium]|nr:winged helix-turn-helix transcriptional regulator [Fusobacteriaceae bacterium]MBN2839035.1 winged helix-turn-helix transcriptional regulator [Fusobacteriaceae bacterium]